MVRRDLVQLIEQGQLGELAGRLGQRSDLTARHIARRPRGAVGCASDRGFPLAVEEGLATTGRPLIRQLARRRSVAAALMLMGDRQRATDLLFRDTALGGGDLLSAAMPCSPRRRSSCHSTAQATSATSHPRWPTRCRLWRPFPLKPAAPCASIVRYRLAAMAGSCHAITCWR